MASHSWSRLVCSATANMHSDSSGSFAVNDLMDRPEQIPSLFSGKLSSKNKQNKTKGFLAEGRKERFGDKTNKSDNCIFTWKNTIANPVTASEGSRWISVKPLVNFAQPRLGGRVRQRWFFRWRSPNLAPRNSRGSFSVFLEILPAKVLYAVEDVKFDFSAKFKIRKSISKIITVLATMEPREF